MSQSDDRRDFDEETEFATDLQAEAAYFNIPQFRRQTFIYRDAVRFDFPSNSGTVWIVAESDAVEELEDME